jgi:hypothetical protein
MRVTGLIDGFGTNSGYSGMQPSSVTARAMTLVGEWIDNWVANREKRDVIPAAGKFRLVGAPICRLPIRFGPAYGCVLVDLESRWYRAQYQARSPGGQNPLDIAAMNLFIRVEEVDQFCRDISARRMQTSST